MTRLSKRFRSLKNPHPRPKSSSSAIISAESYKRAASASASTSASASASASASSSPNRRREGKGDSSAERTSKWSVYLIVSSRLPRTYVGVTTNFSRRLKQHNGELKGGAKASYAGRPWALACIVRGFKDRSEACEFESKWKNISKKMPRKKKKKEDTSNLLLQHREAALNRVEASFDCSLLQIEWQLRSS